MDRTQQKAKTIAEKATITDNNSIKEQQSSMMLVKSATLKTNSTKKQGYLHKRSDHLHQWRKRYLIVEEHVLRIYDDEKMKKNNSKEIPLNEYAIKWNDLKSGFYNFGLHSTNKGNKYKVLIFGEKAEPLIVEWFEFLKPLTFVGANAATLQKSRTMGDSISGNGTPAYYDDEKSEKGFGNDFKTNGTNSPQSSQQQKDDKNGFSDSDSCTTKDKLKEAEEISGNEESKDMLTIPKSPIKNIVKYGEVPMPSDAPAWVADLITEFHLHDEAHQDIDESEEWELVKKEGSLKIFQSHENTQTFRNILKLKGMTQQRPYKILLDVGNRGQWDNSFDQGSIIQFLQSYRHYIVRQISKAYGLLYFPREFIYLRYTFKYKNCYYIFDKSFDDTEVKKSVRAPRGAINYSVTKVYQEQESTVISQHICYTNGGLVTVAQDSQISLYSLGQLTELEKYARKMTVEPEIWTPDELDDLENAPTNPSIFEKPVLDLKNLPSLEIIEPLKMEDSKSDLKSTKKGSDDIMEDEKGIDDMDLNSTKDADTLMILPPTGSKDELLKLLEKINKNQHTLECIDKNVPFLKLPGDEIMKRQPDDFLYRTMWKRDPNGGLELIDKRVLETQKKVVGGILKSLGKNILEGKSVMNISLPIQIFGPESILHRCAMTNVYAPIFLEKAGELTDYLEQIKQTIVFFFTSLHVCLNQEKPFNPILGETYQGMIGGIPIFVEQISHHPPISQYSMRGKKFYLYGSFNIEANLGPNSVQGAQKGRACVTFEDSGMKVYCHFPSVIISGTMFGKRTFNYTKKMKIYETKHSLYSEILFNPDEKGFVTGLFSKKKVENDKATGKIWQCQPDFIAKLVKEDKVKFDLKKHVIKELCTIDSNWLSHLDFDKKRYWSMDEQRPFYLLDVPNKALPSDANFRHDLIQRKIGDLVKGQSEKERMEVIQRADRKLREKLSKGGKKHK